VEPGDAANPHWFPPRRFSRIPDFFVDELGQHELVRLPFYPGTPVRETRAGFVGIRMHTRELGERARVGDN
jgi:hypothetical protein